MNALELIKTDHKQLRAMLASTAAAALPQERADLLHQMRARLMAHERMEEDIFYPALRSHVKAREIVLEGYEEHHVIDMILDELVDVPEDSEVWAAKLKVLTENIAHHIEEEEGEMFRTARSVLSKETLEELGEKMKASKDAASA